jgi:hypothetical protein
MPVSGLRGGYRHLICFLIASRVLGFKQGPDDGVNLDSDVSFEMMCG